MYNDNYCCMNNRHTVIFDKFDQNVSELFRCEVNSTGVAMG